MPAVDDGPLTPSASVRAVEALGDAVVEHAVATPHLEASTLNREEDRGRRLAELDEGWDRLVEAAGDRAALPTLHRGAEIRLDEPLPGELDPRVRLGGTSYVLVEFSSFQLPPYPGRQLAEIVGSGYRPVLAHPERFRGLRARFGEVESWRREGVRLQVNAGSLVGQYGSRVRENAWELLYRGWADVLASDYHGRGDVRLRPAQEALLGEGGMEQWGVLTERNPQRVLSEEDTVAAPALPRERSWWERLRELLAQG